MYSNQGGSHNPYQDMKFLHQDERFAHSYADLYGALPSESNTTGRLITQPQWRTSTEEVGLANKDANKVANKDADSSDDDSSTCHHLTPFSHMALTCQPFTWDVKNRRRSITGVNESDCTAG